MRIAILGNSGSGKSTLAKWLAERGEASLLDLDTIAWQPGQTAVPRSADAARAELISFCSTNARWVVEGCYASLIRTALRFSPRLLFLNPGKEQCIANCLLRPWEPHKYASKAQQDERFAFLLSWVADYYTRDGDMSASAHAECFHRYLGSKQELLSVPVLAAQGAAHWLGDSDGSK
jgi:adenylate kinase family enzyme